MNLTIKLLLFILCLNLNAQIGKAESFYPPPVEKVKPPPAEKKNLKKKKSKVHTSKKIKNRLKFRGKNKRKNYSLESQQMDSGVVDYIALALLVGGLASFIVGSALVNPLIWIIGAIAFVIGFLCFMIVTIYEPHWTRGIILWLLTGFAALLGIVLFIIGLITGTLAFWIGGLIFLLPLVIWVMIFVIYF